MKMLIYILIIISMTQNGQATLTVFPVGPICPQTVVNFTCRTTSSYLRWTANHRGEMIEQITFAVGSSASNEYRVLGGGYLLRAIIVSRTPELISNLTLLTSPELSGLGVQCNSETTSREVSVLHMATPPFQPDNFHVTGIHKEMYYVTVNLQWIRSHPSNHNTSIISNYVVSVRSTSSDVWKIATESTMLALKVPYNINLTISVVAVNCAGSGTPAYLSTLNIVNCSIPPAVDGLVTEPYNDTTEGAVVYFHCDASLRPNSLERRMAVCTSEGSWSSSHGQLQNAIDCMPSTNTIDVDNTEILFQCIKRSGKFFAICTEEINSKQYSQCSPLPVIGNTSDSETCIAADSNIIFELVGVGGAGLAMGAIVGCLLLGICQITQRYYLKKKVIKVESNIAYETVKYPKVNVHEL